MADLDPREVLDQLEGAIPRPEFVSNLRGRIEREALAQSAGTRTAPADATVIDPVLYRDDGTTNMSKNKVIAGLVAAAAVIVVIVGIAIWASSDESTSETEVIDRPDDSEPAAPATTIAAPTVERPEPAPPAPPSELEFAAWLEAFTTFAENRQEGDFLAYRALGFGALLATREDAFDRREAYGFTAQCDLLPYLSSHLAEAPGLPNNPAIADAYQELLDDESVRWAYQQAKCDSVDLDLVRAGLSEYSNRFELDALLDFESGNGTCTVVVAAITRETGETPDVLCVPVPGSPPPVVDRDLPEDFSAYTDS